ncbi:hypothetical protein L861_18965 [Litchfieldella anticariensis FP35 = DSM 16096]|uniref:Uncharacterized protein n=1 Tax=Litchfieldella anticariensis (strain DSM 16096 / CECT 5854 / CIP 108499 / LMG 22089 / FP35) TaxID=1121939 RepID=S2KNB9_LITA3|nr:hypothetical protein L861_18965 [Halomonas anticariensis FP35 = DSM 16096]
MLFAMFRTGAKLADAQEAHHQGMARCFREGDLQSG